MRVDTTALLVWLKARSTEPSTMRAIVGFLMSAGLVVDPAMIEMILSVGIGLISLINLFKKDYASPDARKKGPHA